MIIDPDFVDHWRTRMLIDALNDEMAPIYLIRLWSHCQNRKETTFAGLTWAGVKAICRFPGCPEQFKQALVSGEWVCETESGALEVLKFREHNAQLFNAFENGKRGGRPRKTAHGIPMENPRVSHGLPTENPRKTHGKPIREEKIREEEPPNPPTTGGEVPQPPPTIAPTPKPDRQASGDHAIAVDAFCNAWFARYRTKYPFAGGKDGQTIKFVLSAVSGDLEEFKKVVSRYLADDDSFYASGDRHSLAKMRQHLTRYITDQKPAPARLTHRPQSTQDQILALVYDAAASADEPGPDEPKQRRLF